MTETLGKFSEGFASWRKILASVPAEALLDVFANVASDVATYVARGLDRMVAADELTDMAAAHGLDDADAVQQIIADAFARMDEDLERIPDSIGDIEKPPPHHGPNGKHRGIKILSKAEFVRGFVPPDYLVDGMLQRRFVYALTGQTGHAKTAIALLLAELVSSPEASMLGNHRVEQGRVVYFVGENADDLRMRVIGADSQRQDGDPLADRIVFIPGNFNIGQMYAQISTHIDRLGGCDLVVVDTSAAYFLGNEELNNKQMGDHARMLRKLTELPGGPCVLVLCHPIKYVLEASQLLPRGGGAFLAEMDGNLTAWKHDDTLIELHHGKIRGPGFEALSFKVETIRTTKLTDAQGRMLPTVRAIAISRTDETKQQKKSREDEDKVLAALLNNPDASMIEIAERWGWKANSGEPSKSRVKNAIYRLDQNAKPKMLRKNRDKWELTDEGKVAARRAALDFEAQAEHATSLEQPRLQL